MPGVALGAEPLSWDDYEAVVHGDSTVEIADLAVVDAHRAALEQRLAEGVVIYSVNTGYGAEASRPVAAGSLAQVQVDTVLSHAVGIGPAVDESIVRGMLLLIANAAAQGPPAFTREVVEALVRALNERRHPAVPSLGTHSASDLIPGAHLAFGLLARESGLQLRAKDGALVNNSAFSTALAVAAVRAAERVIARAEDIAAMTLQTLRGFPEAFDERLVALRPHPGALQSAANMRSLLEGSSLLRGPGRPHDPFSLRCLPQIHGAVRSAVAHARAAVEIELHSVTDNPVVLADGTALSGGNFHGEPLGLPLDGISLALGELASLSVQRTRHLLSGTLGTPPKLSPAPSERFGLMMLAPLAAALVSECRQRAAPASRESIPTDAMEDHVSMAALAARQAAEVAELARRVLATELACAAQALDFAGPELAAVATRALHIQVRERLAFVDEDRPVDVEILLDLI